MNAQITGMDEIKTSQRATWMAGDFGQIARYTEAEAQRFSSVLSIPSGARVIDVGCGTGNLALAAARRGARVTGVDIAPNLLEQARSRAKMEGLKVTFDEGDAEQLPYQDESFDFVLSIYGAMFAAQPQRVAAELIRVCCPRGIIAMMNWTPTGFIGQMLKLMSARLPARSGASSPVLWGDEKIVRERFGSGVSKLRLTRRIHHLKFPFSVPETIEFFRLYYGPVSRTFEALEANNQAALRHELMRLWSKHNRAGNRSTHVEAEYLEVFGIRSY